MEKSGIKSVAIVGAGTMGHGIGQEFAAAGYRVVLYDLGLEKLKWAVQSIERNLGELADWGMLSQDEIQPTMDRIRTTTALDEAAGAADLVIEAVFEDIDLKQDVFRKLDTICAEHTILASNTSSLMPSMLASATKRPDRVLVAHYWYPPYLMPLVEIVRCEKTSDQVVETVHQLLKAMGKKPIIVQKEALGFIGNRLQAALWREALYIVEQGMATAEDVDIAVKNGFGRRLGVAGPLQLVEFQDGWDVALQIDKYMLEDLDSRVAPSPLLVEKVERGELGLKTGRGFYEWTPEFAEAFRSRLTKALASYLRTEREDESCKGSR